MLAQAPPPATPSTATPPSPAPGGAKYAP
jgi:hypothetical protein